MKTRDRHHQKEDPAVLGDVMAHIVEGIVMVRRSNLTIVYANSQFENMFGYGEGELTGRHASVLNASSDRTPREIAEEIAGALKSKGLWSGDILNIRKDGTPFWTQAGIAALDSSNYGKVWVSVHRDATGRKRDEEARRESELQYRNLFENSIVGTSQSLPSGRLLRVNRAYALMYGFSSPEEAIARVRSVGRLYANPSDRDTVLRILEEKGIMEPREMKVLRRDGSPFTVLVGVRAIKDPGGKLICYQAEHVDISRQKQAEEKLRISENRYHELFDAASDAIVLIDNTTGRLIQVNRAACTMYGYKRGELLGMRNEDLSAEPAQTRRITRKTPIARDKSVLIPLRWHRKKNGEIFPVEISGRFFMSGGRPVHIAVIRDITRRKKVEESLERSRAELMAIYESAPVMMCLLDPERNILFGNRALSEFLGIPEEKLRHGRACGVFGCINARTDTRGCGFGKDCVSCRIRMAIEDTRKTGTSHRNIEYAATLKHRGKKRKVVLLGSTVQVLQGNHGNVLLCLQDITEQRRMSERVIASEKAAKEFAGKVLSVREDDKRMFSGVLHHETGSLAVGLKAHLATVRNEIRNRRLRTAIKELRETEVLVEQTVARLRDLAASIRPPDLDVLGLSKALTEYCSKISRVNALNIRVTCVVKQRDIEDFAATILFRVVQEALNNVVRHADAAGVTVRVTAAKGTILLAVEDDGKGMDIDTVLAEPGGHIGIRAMKEMVASAMGTFEIRSEPGKGTSISVTVPRTSRKMKVTGSRRN